MSLGMSRYVYSVLVVIATISLLGCVEFFGRGGASFSNPGTGRQSFETIYWTKPI